MTANGLQPSVLRKAKMLKWLLLEVETTLPADWYSELLETVEASLPRFELLELMVKTEKDITEVDESLLSASGREDAVALLRRLIENPGLLGKSSDGKP